MLSIKVITVEAGAVFFEATDRRKATKALHRKEGIIYSSPNVAELRAMARFLSPKAAIRETKDLNEIIALTKIVSQFIDFIIVTVGAKGVFTVNCNEQSNESNNTLVVNHYPVKALSQVESVSGAGDCFASGFIHGMLLGLCEAHNVSIGFDTAKQALFCKNNVPENLSIFTHSLNKAEYVSYKINNG